MRDNGITPTSMNVFIYQDQTTLPGSLVASRTGVTSTAVGLDRSIPLSPPVELQQRTCWVGVQANVPSQS